MVTDTLLDSNANAGNPSVPIWEINSSGSLQEFDSWGVLPNNGLGQSQPMDTAMVPASQYFHSSYTDGNFELMKSNWPRNLPTPDVTRHLCGSLVFAASVTLRLAIF